MLELTDIKKFFYQDYVHNQTTRRKAADDRLFSHVTQWDVTLLNDTQLAYRGEFDILRKATRGILSDLRSNPVQINFEPKADSREDGAEILDGLYLTDDRLNASIEAYNNASEEVVDCGIGGWEICTEYESSRTGDKHQVIRRKPIYEFNNNAFPDCNAKLLDKSDAKRWTLLEPYSRDGYKDLYKELTGEETDILPNNFASPEISYVFPWVIGNEIFYVAKFYHKEKVKDRILTMTTPDGQKLMLMESSLDDIMDDLMEQGYTVTDKKDVKRWKVTCYICSGEKILKTYEVAGENIPVVPVYGERAFVEGEEVYEGVIRLGKDPQRLRNFLMSYLGDIAARSPREKPIFGAEQIAGFEHMYEQTGSENNFPYLLQHLKDANGNPLPMGPLNKLEAPNIPPALVPLLELTRQSVDDVANEGLPKDVMETDLSGRAVELIQHRLDRQSMIYQDHLKHAKRYDAVVYASMATVVYDAPRKVTMTLPDGTRKTEEIMKTVLDRRTGELVVLNDLTNMEFEVYADIGKTYNSLREKTREELGEIAEQVGESDPILFKALTYKRIQLMEGVNMEDVREYTNKQLLLMGFKKPETEEEIAFLKQAQSQPTQPDAAMVEAQAEQGRAQALILKEQRQAIKDQKEAEVEDARVQILAYNAETARQELDIKRKKAQAETYHIHTQRIGQHIDNVRNITDAFRSRVNK